MVDIFLSYAEEDRESARRIATLLEQSGWTVWWDRRIRAGARWRSAIANSLSKMRCMVVLWSNNSVASEWVNEEAEQARLAGKLIPVLIDHVRPPLGFQEYQCADLADWNGSPRASAFRQLILDIKAHVGASAASAEGRVEAQTAPLARAEADRDGARRGDNAMDADRHGKTGLSRRRIALSLLVGLLVVVTAATVIASLENWWTPTEGNFPAMIEAPSAVSARETGATPQAPGSIVRQPSAEGSPELPKIQGDRGGTAQGIAKKTTPQPPKVASERDPRDLGAAPAANSRCGDILQRLQLGETLSDDDWHALRRDCR